MHAQVCVGTFFYYRNKCSHCSQICKVSVDIPTLSLCHLIPSWISLHISFKILLLLVDIFSFSQMSKPALLIKKPSAMPQCSTFSSQAHSHGSQLWATWMPSLHLNMLSSFSLMNHIQLQRGQTDHHRGSYNHHVPVTSIPGNHKCWIGHSSKGEKLLIGCVTQVLRVPPRDRGSHYYSLMTMDTDFFCGF